MEQIIHKVQDYKTKVFFREKDSTLVVDLPPGEFLRNLMAELVETEMLGDKKIHIKIGTAVCSLKDQYCKKTGVKLARSRMEAKEFTVSGFRATLGMYYIYFEQKESKDFLSLRFIGDHVRVDGYTTLTDTFS